MLRKLAVVLFIALCLTPAVRAADYPARPVTLVVAFTPGGPSDVLSRIVGKQLEKILGQTFIIDNRPGGAGNIAAEVVAHAAPDGYTLLMGNNSILATNGALFKKLNYDAEKDFAPISMIGTQPNILVVNSALPVQSMADLIALAKASPGKLNYANSGYGAAAHLSAELFKAEAHVDIVAVSYKGAAPALQDVIAGHVQLMFATSASVIGHIKAGTLRPLAVTTIKRTSLKITQGAFSSCRMTSDAMPMSFSHDRPLTSPPRARRSRRRDRGQHAGGIFRLYRARDSEMDRGREGVGGAAGIGRPSFGPVPCARILE